MFYPVKLISFSWHEKLSDILRMVFNCEACQYKVKDQSEQNTSYVFSRLILEIALVIEKNDLFKHYRVYDFNSTVHILLG